MNPLEGLADAIVARARPIRALVLDVDGILTDGRLLYANSGEELKAFNIQDGLGIKLVQGAGIKVAIITSRKSPALERRAHELGVERVWVGVEYKLEAFRMLTDALQLAPEQCAAMGDDLPDLPVLKRCGFSATVPEAPAVVRAHATHVTRRAGGAGAVREICELLLASQGQWENTLKPYLA